MRIFILVACLAFAAGCGSSTNRPAAGQLLKLTTPDSAQAAQLPAIPASSHFVPQKAVADVDISKPGVDAAQSGNATAVASSLQLQSVASSVAYALYRFDGVPGDTVAQVSFAGSGLNAGGNVWLALADYSSGRWSFLDELTTAASDIDTSALNCISPGGDVYLLVAVCGGDGLTVDTVSIRYTNRYAISGQVVDDLGAPLPDTTVSMPLFQLTTQTDASGVFTLSGVPPGTWPVVATKDSWTFYSNPALVTMAAVDVTGVSFRGMQLASNFLPTDISVWDGSITAAGPADFSGTVGGSLSAVDDKSDYWRFTVDTPGDYYLTVRNPDMDILFPLLEVFDNTAASQNVSYFAYRGVRSVPFTAAAPGDYIVKVSCTGGGGDYTLALDSGVPHLLKAIGELGGDDKLPIELVMANVEGLAGDVTEYICYPGLLEDGFRMPVASTVSLSAPRCNFTPASRAAALDIGDVINLRFNGSISSLSDSLEPNNTFAQAATLTLPYDSEVAAQTLSLSGATDNYDYYRLTPFNGEGILARLNAPQGIMDAVGLSFDIVDGSGNSVANIATTPTGYEARLAQPASGVELFVLLRIGSGQRRFEYDLQVETYFPLVLYFEALSGIDPLENVRVDVRDAASTWRRTLTTTTNGRTGGLFFKEGEALTFEIFRYGLDIDRQTLEFIVPPEYTKYPLNSDKLRSIDTNEVDNIRVNAPLVALPYLSTGTLEPLVDPQDHLKFNVAASTPVSVTLDLTDPNALVQVNILDSLGGIASTGVAADGIELVLDSGPSPGARYLQLVEFGYRVQYALDLH